MMALAAVFPLGIDGHHVHRSQFPVVCQVTGESGGRGEEEDRGGFNVCAENQVVNDESHCTEEGTFSIYLFKLNRLCFEGCISYLSPLHSGVTKAARF